MTGGEEARFADFFVVSNIRSGMALLLLSPVLALQAFELILRAHHFTCAAFYTSGRRISFSLGAHQTQPPSRRAHRFGLLE